ncbi:tetratricopeptide repeat protein [Streptomyces nodosus]|uniref:ATP/GTP-binding protein n=2 Tax=Streptomyces nodosus TaxID=40318 RepID=A0A0B5DIN9_9ACTN|nr:tetratricopeptide repeat protein [Streptomyces nodosus]AJE43084.1 ATP/GTP-binding protein [Streptomyces nodosus]MBB4794473.1 tetratricopeptide (TPR) repeat protein [Streptomyces nodosus]
MTGEMDGHAEGRGRVYQASGDQHISEHHHYGEHGDGAVAPPGPDSVRRPAVGRPPVVLRDRAEVLERLLASVRTGQTGEVYVLYGMGGCGKTAVAYTLFQLATGECGRVGLWVNAADRASLRAGMLAVAADRGAGDGELLAARNGLRPAADLVWQYLDRSAEPWLLVLDNTDHPEILRDGSWLRTSPMGTVVVTTRRPAARWWPGAELQHIGVLPREDAARVLQDLAPHSGTQQEAARIADRLGRLPLALTLAGGFLSQQVLDPWTMETYGRRLEEGGGVDLIDQGADALSEEDPRHLVGLTWQLTLDAFEARGLPEATALLRLLSRFAPEPLPLSLLSHAEISGVLPRARCETALRALLDQSLTELLDVGERCVTSHAVLLDSVVAATPANVVPMLHATAVRLLDAAVPEVPDAGPYDPLLRLLVPHGLALLRRAEDPSTSADALAAVTRLSTALHRTGDYVSAWETARAAADLGEQRLGAEHRLVLAAGSRAGRALFRLGEYVEAELLLRRLHTTQERLFGADDPDTLDSRHGLQLVLGNVGERDEAVSLLRSTVVGRRRALGPAHPLTLRSRSSLLVLLSASESVVEEDGALLSLPTECVRFLGPDHTVTLGAHHNHAWALYLLGRFDEAEQEIRRVTEAYRRRFGPDHPIALSAQQLLSRIRAARGDLVAAGDIMADVVARRERGLGADHPFTVAGRRLLGEFTTGLGRPPEARG